MTQPSPTTEEEWTRFRFPARVARPDPPPAPAGEEEDDEDDEGEGEGGGGGPTLTPDLPPSPAWEYCPDSGFLRNVGLGKKIDLDHLNDAAKIVRLLSVFELRPDLAFPSLRRALETASQARFGLALDEVLQGFAEGPAIPWKARPAAQPGLG